jgi:hypothetical protein
MSMALAGAVLRMKPKSSENHRRALHKTINIVETIACLFAKLPFQEE